jgi:hypothetical protein
VKQDRLAWDPRRDGNSVSTWFQCARFGRNYRQTWRRQGTGIRDQGTDDLGEAGGFIFGCGALTGTGTEALANRGVDRRVYFASGHTSRLVGWQEGAALSAYRVIKQLGERTQGGTATEG